jgi:hypothetical protein
LEQAFDRNMARMTKLAVEAVTAPPGRLQGINREIQQAAALHKTIQALGKAKAASNVPKPVGPAAGRDDLLALNQAKAASQADQAKLDGLVKQALAPNVSIEQLKGIATAALAISAEAKN